MLKSLLRSSAVLLLLSLSSLSATGQETDAASACCLAAPATAPTHIIFTYMGDPSTTLTVNWQTHAAEPGAAVVHYDTVSHADGTPADYAHSAKGKFVQIEGLENRDYFRAELTGLKAATTYYIMVGDQALGLSEELKVKTIPNDDRPLRFVTGGDMGTSPHSRTLMKHSASYNPQFAVIGGDIAYANGRLEAVSRWDTWFTYYSTEMVTPEGYSIPIVAAIGNHEINFAKDPTESPFYFVLFGQAGGDSHFVRQFGENLILFVLDTGHQESHASQVDWMRSEFSKHQNMKYKAAVYHVPLYPTHRDFMTHESKNGREHWSPLFDDFGLTVAFENHDHTFKRTHLIKNGEIATDGEGTLYLGDGCWGTGQRPIGYEPRWYQKVRGSIQHFWVVDMDNEHALYRAVDIENQVFDVYPESDPSAAAAQAVMAAKVTEYLIPYDAVTFENFTVPGDEWLGGPSTLTVSNQFEHPVRYTFQFRAYIKDCPVEGVGFPEQELTLQPGETQEFPITLTPAAAVPLKQINMRVKVSMQMDHPNHEAPIRFKGSEYIKVTQEKVEE